MAKISAFDIVWLLMALSILWALTIWVNYQHSNLTSKIEDLKKKETENNTQIQEHPMYKRLDNYWFQVNIAKNITEYKKFDIAWNDTVKLLKAKLPKEVTIRSLQKSEDGNKGNITFSAPSEKLLLLAMKEVNTMNEFSNVDFNNITKEKVSFIWDRTQYVGYATTATLLIDEEFLKEKYLTPPEQEEIVETETEDISLEEWTEETMNTASWEISEETENLPSN